MMPTRLTVFLSCLAVLARPGPGAGAGKPAALIESAGLGHAARIRLPVRDSCAARCRELRVISRSSAGQ